MLTQIHTEAIVKLMHTAKLHIAWPKIRLHSLINNGIKDEELTIQLSVAGNKAQFPNSINITDGKPYGESKFYGRILVDGQLKLRIESDIIEHELELFAENPAGYAKLYSDVTGNCMFCSRLLTDPQSVVVGYGPVCAAHYGLPHGNIETKVAKELAQVEMPMPDVDFKLTGDKNAKFNT